MLMAACQGVTSSQRLRRTPKKVMGISECFPSHAPGRQALFTSRGLTHLWKKARGVSGGGPFFPQMLEAMVKELGGGFTYLYFHPFKPIWRRFPC